MIEINGKNIHLRTMNQKEMRALWRKYEPENGQNYVYDEEKVDMYYERSAEKEEWNPVVGIFLRNDEVIGQLTFIRIVYSEKRCELGLFFATEAIRKKDYGIEAIGLAKKYAKEKMGLTRIYADASTKDERLQTALKENGFLHTKTYKDSMPDGGDRMSFVVML